MNETTNQDRFKQLGRNHSKHPPYVLNIRKAITPKAPWTYEMYRKRIGQTQTDIANINRQMNEIDSRMNELRENKRILTYRVAKKYAYVKLLNENIKEHFPERVNAPIIEDGSSTQ